MPEERKDNFGEENILVKQEKSLLQDKVNDLEDTVKELKKKLEKKDISAIRRVERKVKQPTIVRAKLGGR
jgi:uncharacterized protein with PhoU and TrkA domain